MPSHDMNLANDSGANYRTDNNNALAALVQHSSGASAPSTTFAHMFWADTTPSGYSIFKVRDAANAAWSTVFDDEGRWKGADGTVGEPSLSFGNDVNTGLYRIGADQIGMATGGVLALAIDGSQQIGIGTSAPDELVHIKTTTATLVLLELEREEDSAIGPILKFTHDSASPAIGDSIGSLKFFAKSSIGSNAKRAEFYVETIDPTDGSDEYKFVMKGVFAGVANIEYASFGSTGIVLNSDGVGIDTRIEGVSDPNLFVCNAGNDRVGISTSPDFLFEIGGEFAGVELSADPSDPVEGKYVIWMSNGVGSGDDGDIMIKIQAGAAVKTATLVDFSAI